MTSIWRYYQSTTHFLNNMKWIHWSLWRKCLALFFISKENLWNSQLIQKLMLNSREKQHCLGIRVIFWLIFQIMGGVYWLYWIAPSKYKKLWSETAMSMHTGEKEKQWLATKATFSFLMPKNYTTIFNNTRKYCSIMEIYALGY